MSAQEAYEQTLSSEQDNNLAADAPSDGDCSTDLLCFWFQSPVISAWPLSSRVPRSVAHAPCEDRDRRHSQSQAGRDPWLRSPVGLARFAPQRLRPKSCTLNSILPGVDWRAGSERGSFTHVL